MPQLRRTPVTWLIYVQLGLWCYFLYGFGPVMPLLRDEQGTSATLASLHSTALALGGTLGGVVFPIAVRRLGRDGALWASLIGVALCVLGFVALPAAYPVTLTLAFLVSVSGIVLVCGVVSALTRAHGPAGPAAISEANAVACVAGLIAPLLIGVAVNAHLGWRPGLALLTGLIALTAVVAVLLGIRVPSDAPLAEDEQVVGSTAKTPLPKAYWFAWGMMTITGAVEIMLSMWTATMLRDRVDFSAGSAAAATSAMVGGMFLGRLVGARMTLRVRSVPLYFSALAISATGFALFWSAGVPVMAILGLLVLGLGNAMHYPLAISLAMASAPEQPDRASGVASYSMGLSFGAGPLLLGLLADRYGAHTAFLLVPVLLLAAGLLAYRLSLTLALPPQIGDRAVELGEHLP